MISVMKTGGLGSGPALVAVLFACSPLARVLAQDRSAAELPEFEVASIKPVAPNAQHMVGVTVYPGARLVIHLTLKGLVAAAFGMSYWQISGGDPWTKSDAYDLEAKPPENLLSNIKTLRYTLFGINDAYLREMLQTLLIDRFQLKLRRETQTGTVYLLERNGRPPGLRHTETPSADAEVAAHSSEEDIGYADIGYAGGTWVIHNTMMSQLAEFASGHVVHAPVSDRTQLVGAFDYKQTVPDLEPNYSDPSDSFLHVLRELGLKLERSKGPVETLVIDHAEKPVRTD
jgi:uncharacterized protein (TIGR03435 family)